jgi:Zn-dependent protease/predicted transcriptional regulator
MGWSFRIARIAGIDVKIHFTFLLFLGWLGFAYWAQGGAPAAAQGIIFILALFGCVLLHEMGHAFAARLFGIRTPDITLLPIGGVARLQRMPDRPWQEIVVAIAGPAVNVVIAAVLLGVHGYLTDPVHHLRQLDDPRIGLLAKLAAINIWLVIFNMIPAFPMDGGRVLRAVLALFMRHSRATRVAAGIGQVVALAFGFAGLMWNPMLLFIAVFVYLGAAQEAAYARLQEVSRDWLVRDVMITQFISFPQNAPLEEPVEALLRTSQREFPVLDDDGRVIGILTQAGIIRAWQRFGPGTPVAQIMHPDVPVLSQNAPFDRAFQRLQESESPALAAVDPSGQLAGLVTPENISEVMLIRSARAGEEGMPGRLADKPA